jgi:nitrate/nitrite-specific signal transduction histidine kinase
MEIPHVSAESLAADIASALVKATAVTTARDLEINTLQINYENMFKQNAKEHEDIKETLKSIADNLEKMIEKLDKKYAPMWVRNVIVWSGGIIGTSLILYVVDVLFIR